jgi:cadherin-related family protein 4
MVKDFGSTVVRLWSSFQMSSMMSPLLLTDTESFWQPEPWFVVVLTMTGVLVLLTLGWLLGRFLQG